MINYRLIEWFAAIFNGKFFKDIALNSYEYAKYSIGYSKFFKKIKNKDIVIIRYINWRNRDISIKMQQKIQITNSMNDLQNLQDLRFSVLTNRHKTKELLLDSEIVGIVLKTWESGYDSGNSSTKYNAIAVFGGDTIYIIYNFDWLRGIEVVTPETEGNISILKKIKWFL